MRTRASLVAVLLLALLPACEDPKPLFGLPGGLQRRQGTVVGACPTLEASGADCPGWTAGVYPLLNDVLGGTENADGTKGCGKSGGCHQPPNGLPPLFYSGDPAATLQAFKDYSDPPNKGDADQPYVVAGDIKPTDPQPWITCSLTNDPDFASEKAMPLGAPRIPAADPAAWDVIRKWAYCKYPEGPGEGGGGPMGGGGAGGAGGN